jgi:transposase InsO family protein
MIWQKNTTNDNIITCFDHLIHLVSDQRSHFISSIVKTFVEAFMIIRHESTTYYPQGNGHTKWTNKILKQILTKVINVNQNDWDVMLTMASWAYQMAYRITTQHSPYELIYGLMLLLPTKVIIPMNWTSVKRNGNMENALLIQMKYLVLLNEKHYC